MKKQLLIAAVAATMTSVAMADVSIIGSGKLNYTNTDNQTANDSNAFTTDLVLEIVGKSGDTSVHFKEEFNDANGTDGMNMKNAYMKSKIAGVNVQAGSWYGSDSLLGNGGAGNGKFSADYTIEGVKIQYEAQNDSDESVTVSGTVGGVSLSHEVFQSNGTSNSDTKVSGSVAGVGIAYRTIDSDTATNEKESLEVNYTTNDVTLTYAEVDVNSTGTTTSDAFFGTQASAVGDMSGFGLKTALAGNTVQLKSYKINPDNASGSKDNDYIKFVVTRPLASGATFEATYTDKDDTNGTADSETLDLELAVKF